MNLRDRPYLDVEVVEVKVKKKKEIPVHCVECDIKLGCGIYQRKYKKLEKEGTLVNGENLNKIKFPCYCSFDANKGVFGEPERTYKVHGIGMINENFYEGQINYELSWADHQQKDINVLCGTPSLKRLIEIYDIHIEKAKIVIFKEIH